MPRAIPLQLWLALFLALSLFASAALAQGVHIESIFVSGQAAEQVEEVLIVTAQMPTGQRRTIRRNETLGSGFEIVAPSTTVLVLRSDNGNRIVLEPGTRLRVADVTQAGERYLLRIGTALFEVIKALSFFNVEFEEQFSAQVRGTQFRISGEQAQSGARFTCEVLSGKVLVRRPERIRVGRRQMVFTQTALLLTPDGQQKVEWQKSDVDRMRSFRTIDEAERYLRGRLQQAQAEPLDVVLTLGRLAESTGDPARALRIYQSAEVGLALDPRVAELHMRTADLLADARRKDEALHRYDLAREVYNSLYAPDASREVAHVLSRQGDLYRQTGEAARALDKYREAVQVEERAATSKPDALLRRNIDSLEVRPSLPLEQQRQRIDQR